MVLRNTVGTDPDGELGETASARNPSHSLGLVRGDRAAVIIPCLKWNLGWGLPAREAVLREMRRFGCKRTLQDSDAEHSWAQ